MGVYSELDLERRYGDDPFTEDNSFVEVDTPAEDNPFAEDDAPAPGGADGVPAVTVEPEQVKDIPAVQPQADQAPVSDNGAAQPAVDKAADEDAKRKAHEEAEAKRKAEWKAEKKKRKEAEKLLIAQIDNMSNDEVTAKSLERVSADTEKLTRRHMMECVMEHIQTLCLDDPAFARKVMHPRKNMIRCCQYINRKAWEYVQDELKARGITPSRENPYGSAIPEGVCYQWAVDYFNTPDVKEDVEKEEKFVPKPYRGTSTTPPKSTAAKSATTAKASAARDTAQKETKAAAPKKPDDSGQISFGDFAIPEEKAG